MTEDQKSDYYSRTDNCHDSLMLRDLLIWSK